MMYRTTTVFMGFLLAVSAIAAMPALADDSKRVSKHQRDVKPVQAQIKPGRIEHVQIKHDVVKPGHHDVWRKFWRSDDTRVLTGLGFSGTCRMRSDSMLVASPEGVTNVGAETARFSCRMSLNERRVRYQVSVLTDHNASTAFNCATGPVRQHDTRDKYDTRTVAPVSDDEVGGTDRDDWGFVSSQRLRTLEVRCRIPAGGVVRNVSLIDCRSTQCTAIADEQKPRPRPRPNRPKPGRS